MREVHTEIEINGTPEQVWEHLAAFQAYPAWNPFIRSVEGAAEPGRRLKVRLQPPGGRGFTFRPTVTKVEKGREVRWLGHLLVSGIFDGEHIFEIHQDKPGVVRFVQREEFRCLLSPVMLRMVGPSTRRGFEAMNRALKVRVEAPKNAA